MSSFSNALSPLDSRTRFFGPIFPKTEQELLDPTVSENVQKDISGTARGSPQPLPPLLLYFTSYANEKAPIKSASDQGSACLSHSVVTVI